MDQEQRLKDSGAVRIRISWKNLKSGVESHGLWFGTSRRDELMASISEMNLKYAGEIAHWLEEQPSCPSMNSAAK